MGLLPKHSIGDFVIAYIHNPSLGKDVEHLFKVETREIFRKGFRLEWLYRGNFFSITNDNPLEIKYFTTGARCESDIAPLESRIDMGQWAKKEDPKTTPYLSSLLIKDSFLRVVEALKKLYSERYAQPVRG